MGRKLCALVFDVDGTLADTERFHRRAFNEAFSAEGLDWHWDEALYTRLLDISGGRERILYYWNEVRGRMVDIEGNAVRDTVERIHQAKTAAYEAMVGAGLVQLRPGVPDLIDEARREGLQLAIATTTSPVNVGSLLRRAMGSQWHLSMPVVCDGSTAPRKKPHPQVYLQVLQRLKLPAEACVAFEDSANGLRAATAAGLQTVITPTAFTRHHDFDTALRVLQSLSGVSVADIAAWRAQPLPLRSPAPARVSGALGASS